MQRLPIRLFALALLVLVVVAQAHVWLESSPARTPGHSCQVCVTGAVAILSVAPELSIALAALRLETEAPRATPGRLETEASAPRAPPLA